METRTVCVDSAISGDAAPSEMLGGSSHLSSMAPKTCGLVRQAKGEEQSRLGASLTCAREGSLCSSMQRGYTGSGLLHAAFHAVPFITPLALLRRSPTPWLPSPGFWRFTFYRGSNSRCSRHCIDEHCAGLLEAIRRLSTFAQCRDHAA